MEVGDSVLGFLLTESFERYGEQTSVKHQLPADINYQHPVHQLSTHGFSELYGRLRMNTNCTLTAILQLNASGHS